MFGKKKRIVSIILSFLLFEHNIISCNADVSVKKPNSGYVSGNIAKKRKTSPKETKEYERSTLEQICKFFKDMNLPEEIYELLNKLLKNGSDLFRLLSPGMLMALILEIFRREKNSNSEEIKKEIEKIVNQKVQDEITKISKTKKDNRVSQRIGLRNLGNSCYFSAFLHNINSVPFIRERLREEARNENSKNKDLSIKILEMLNYINGHSSKSYNELEKLYEEIRGIILPSKPTTTTRWDFGFPPQNDACEFIGLILSKFFSHETYGKIVWFEVRAGQDIKDFKELFRFTIFELRQEADYCGSGKNGEEAAKEKEEYVLSKWESSKNDFRPRDFLGEDYVIVNVSRHTTSMETNPKTGKKHCATKYLKEVNIPLTFKDEVDNTAYDAVSFVWRSPTDSVMSSHYTAYFSEKDVFGEKQWFCANDGKITSHKIKDVEKAIKNATCVIYKVIDPS
ncbi:MAG: hypothetical protein CfP315_0525 [Candidatus Improbicoccus pseudotrichonymphae]|uniref:USP domain-containing protein n=1 Tax=Candidatus Improbicoccus pseudotrichonymphae TaxID=3033792 RepID=A0AA48HV49_9FIRM|nr:MAG: hypothetical protein CfP315_0525 [Candidatus Improbicoccus pseudotrichonymphae]